MPRTTSPGLAPWSANAASIHPRLDRGHEYHRRCAEVRNELLSTLTERLGCRHRLYLTSNTTSALLTVLGFAASNGLLPLEVFAGAYPTYADELPLLFECLPSGSTGARSRLLTHLCPLTGEIRELPSPNPVPFTIVDAAQSLGTNLQEELFERGPLFVAPAHKHLGLEPGLGFVGVRDDLIAEELRDPLHHNLSVMQHGTVSMELLESALRRARGSGLEGLRHNSARIQVGAHLQGIADTLGLEILTPPGMQWHIVSFRGKDGQSITDALDLERFPGKYFRALGIARLSFHSDDLPGDDPAQLEELVGTILVHSSRR